MLSLSDVVISCHHHGKKSSVAGWVEVGPEDKARTGPDPEKVLPCRTKIERLTISLRTQSASKNKAWFCRIVTRVLPDTYFQSNSQNCYRHINASSSSNPRNQTSSYLCNIVEVSLWMICVCHSMQFGHWMHGGWKTALFCTFEKLRHVFRLLAFPTQFSPQDYHVLQTIQR